MRRRLVTVIALLAVLVSGCAGMSGMDWFGTNDDDTAQFREVSAEIGFNYTSTDSLRPSRGGAVYVTDFDNDGWQDILALGGAPRRAETSRYIQRQPVLFKNTEGSFEPSGVLPAADLDGEKFLGAVFFDYDRDGWEDLVLLRDEGKPMLLANEQGKFEYQKEAFETRLEEPIGAAVADYNRDGHLDLFIYQNGDWKNTTPKGYSTPNKSIEDDNGKKNILFMGTGAGFEQVNDSGIAGTRWSLAASFVDLTGDGLPDIHIANDYNNDYVYVNHGNSTFEQIQLGEATDRNGMSSEVADLTGDERPDIFVTNIYFNKSTLSGAGTHFVEYILGKRMAGNTLLVNRDDGRFVDRATEYGVRKGGWGWAATTIDFDHDGDRDLLHTTRRFTELFDKNKAETYTRYPAFFERIGTTFVSRNASALGFKASNGLGVASLDYDRDGDRDVVVAQQDSIFQIYENNGPTKNWLEIRIAGDRVRNVYGATVRVTTANRTQFRMTHARVDFGSQESRVRHIGLGNAEQVTLQVVWPDGTMRTFKDIDVNQRVIVTKDGIQTVGHK